MDNLLLLLGFTFCGTAGSAALLPDQFDCGVYGCKPVYAIGQFDEQGEWIGCSTPSTLIILDRSSGGCWCPDEVCEQLLDDCRISLSLAIQWEQAALSYCRTTYDLAGNQTGQLCVNAPGAGGNHGASTAGCDTCEEEVHEQRNAVCGPGGVCAGVRVCRDILFALCPACDAYSCFEYHPDNPFPFPW